PIQIDEGASHLCVRVARVNRESALERSDFFRITSQHLIAESNLLEGKEIARIKLQGALHILQPFIMLPLPAPDVAGQLKDMRIVRQRPPRRIEFLQSGAVIQVHPVKIFSAREVDVSSTGT